MLNISYHVCLANRRQNEEDRAREIREQAYSIMAEESQLAATLKQIFIEYVKIEETTKTLFLFFLLVYKFPVKLT